MKKSILCIAVITLVIFSCDRRGSHREHLQKAISEFNPKLEVIDIVNYYPRNYTEVQTDSIISNTFKVSIKNYSRMDSQILLSSETINHETNINYHRVFESEIRIRAHSKLLLNTTFNALDFQQNSQSDFWKDATLEHVWVNQDASNDEHLNLGISIINPKSKAYKFYELVINTEGKKQLQLIEEHS